MPKKTIAVEPLRLKINRWLGDPDFSQEEKRAFSMLLEDILHDTGNYKGFNYNLWSSTGFNDWEKSGRPDFPEKQKFLGPEYDRHYY